MKNFLFFILFCIIISGISSAQIFTIPYSDDFETGAPGWISSPTIGTAWELGNPTYGLTNSTQSGTNCWDINLFTPYTNYANCWLRSPAFDLSNVNGVNISFWQNRNTEAYSDGFHLEYVTDTIGPWIVLGGINTPGALNWYSGVLLTSSGLPAWDDNSNGWVQSSILIPNFSGGSTVWFRFVFTSDGSVTYDGVSIDDFSITPANLNVVSGTAYIDVNGDFLIDAGDIPAPNLTLNLNPAAGYYYQPTDSIGEYYIFIDSAVTTTITPVPPLYSTVTPANYVVTLNGSGFLSSGNDFLITYMPGVIDPAVNVTTTPVRPGLNHTKNIQYTNFGTTSVSGSISMMFDTSFTIISSTDPYTTIAPYTLEFLYTELMPGENRFIQCVFLTDSALSIGTITNTSVIIFPLAGDTNVVNNYDTVFNNTVNSYDPNNKLVDPEGDLPAQQVAAGLDLDYTINFQNVGTADAIHINIYDVLDEDLDISTFEITGSSHLISSWSINSNRQFHVSYANINLADSTTNEPGSHGFLAYMIRPYTNLTAGTEISNTAAIFFDNNLPVITNTTSSIIVNPTGAQELPGSIQLHLFPNPNNGNFYLRADADFTFFRIFNAIGQELVHEKILVPGVLQEVSHNLPSGLYLIVATGNNLSSTLTMIIE